MQDVWMQRLCDKVGGGVERWARPMVEAVHEAVVGVGEGRGLLLHGPCGAGKTALVDALISSAPESLGLTGRIVNAVDLFKSGVGDSESALRAVFLQASQAAPCLLVLDNVELLAPSAQQMASSSVSGRRISNELAGLLDSVGSLHTAGTVFVIGITSQGAGSIDSKVRRPGRLSWTVEIPAPNVSERLAMLQGILQPRGRRGEEAAAIPSLLELTTVSEKTPGFVAADLKRLVQEAGLCALRRCAAEKPSLLFPDLLAALETVGPTAAHSAGHQSSSSVVPETNFGDMLGITEIVQELKHVLVDPFHRAVKSDAGALNHAALLPSGILLHGPPGCGKTAMANALGRECGVNFLPVQATTIVSKVVGESEKNVAKLFQQARALAPCVLFLDQVESVAFRRSFDSAAGHSLDRVLSCLLTEMDGAVSGGSSMPVIVVAATSRIDLLDPTVLRPGRLEHHVLMPMPSCVTRLALLSAHTARMPLHADVNLPELSTKMEGRSCSDVISACREAAMSSLRVGDVNMDKTVSTKDFECAIGN